MLNFIRIYSIVLHERIVQQTIQFENLDQEPINNIPLILIVDNSKNDKNDKKWKVPFGVNR